MNTKTSIIFGLVGAVAAGVLVGLLLAPDKGTEMRRKIGQTTSDWADHLTDLFANAKGELQNLASRGGKEARRAANEAGNTFNNMKESYS